MPNTNNHISAFCHPNLYYFGIGLGLWLMTINGFSSEPLPAPEKTITEKAPSTVNASYLYDEALLTTQREKYRQAESALRRGRHSTFKQLLDSLQDYPLYPYLQYQQMARKLGSLTQAEIDLFLQTNDGTIIADQLRFKLMNYYARNQRWQELVHIYQPQPSTHLQCKYLQALIETNQSEQAFTMAEQVWLTGKSQPNACDPVFSAWETAGHRTNELTWQRIKLAMASGRTRLAQHLSASLPNQDQEVVNLWVRAHRKPDVVLSNYMQQLQHEEKNHILIHAIKRLTHRDIDQAIELWHKLDATGQFSQQEQFAVSRYIGLKLARNHHPDAYDWLNRIPPELADTETQEWAIRSSIRHANWPQVLTAIENMPVQQQSQLRWQFWWAYAHEQLGNINDAEGIYHYLAGRRNYYGFLAADRLHLPYEFENRPLDVDTNDLLSISHYPEAIRAHELYKLNKPAASRREWYRLTDSLSEHQKLAASKLAQHWGWHDRAIVTMGKTDYRDDIELRFPLALKEKVEEWSNKHSIETAWTYAIIRRESAFMHDARSSVGALGLMQLLPGTARQVARYMKVRYSGKHSLLRTDTNIKLGTGYLEQILRTLDSQTVLATAAYNAGPHRVKGWLPEHDAMEAIRWIETIPFTETREYVSNVLAYTIIYQHLMDDEYTRLYQRMPPIPPKNPPPATAEITYAQPGDQI